MYRIPVWLQNQQLRTGFTRVRTQLFNESLFLASVFFGPLALMAFTLGIWALAEEMAFAANFPVTHGAFSNWRLWLALAASLEVAAVFLRGQRGR